MHYGDDPRFRNYYLEDSYVLAIDETHGELSFKLDVVLTPTHPEYKPAKQNEQHCYRHAKLVFLGIENVNWTGRKNSLSVDASGEVDFGNIDAFEILADDEYRLEGDWGAVRVVARHVSIDIDPIS